MAASVSSPPPDAAAADEGAGPAPPRAERLLETLRARGVEVRLDGTEIGLRAPPGVLDPELLSELRSAKPALVQLLAEAERAPFPLSDVQQEILYAAEVEGAAHSYTIVKVLRLAGRLDTDRLKAALAKLQERHPMLGARIGTDPLVQSLHASAEPAIEEAPDMSDEAELLSGIARRAFAAEGGPLASWLLAKVGPERHLLIFSCHHVIADGASLRILFEDLAAFYNDPEGEARRPVASLGFKAHVSRQIAYAGSEDCRQALAGWADLLDGHDAPVHLSRKLAGLGMAQISSSGALHRTDLGSDRIGSLEAVARRLTCSVTSLLLAAYALLVGQQAGRRSFCLGVPFERRPEGGFERTFGCFAALLPCPVDLDPAQPFASLARSLHGEILDARDRQLVPLSRLRSLLLEGRGGTREAPIRVGFSLQAETLPPLALAGLSCTEIPVERDRSRLDLTLIVDPSASGGALNWEYRSAALDDWQVHLISERYVSLLDRALADPMVPLGRLSTLSSADEAAARALIDSGPAAPFRSAPDMVRAVALERPDHPAIVDGGESWTYARLVGRSDAMARAFLEQGVRRGEIVFVVLPRSADLTLCELALMTIGAVPAPFDPANPPARLKAAMEQCGARTAIVPDGAARCDGTDMKWLAPPPAGAAAADALAPVTLGPEDAAYLIHSSGSTGTPKGAAVPHRALANFVRGLQSADLIRPSDRNLHSSGPGFDAAIIEAWGALCAGATLVIVPDALRTDPDGLFGFVAENRVTTAWIPTPVLNAILASGAPDVPAATPLRLVTTGGDRLAHFPPANFPCPVANMYGPCENAPVSTVETLPPGSRRGVGEPPPIGRPLPGISAYVLDDWGRLCPIGVEGELHLAGESLATGYVGLDDLTRERFVEDPFVPGRRMYRTGDRVEIARDGTLLFVGRRDRQVQVEGVRVEPGEVEAALGRIPWVRDSRVTAAAPAGLTAFVACGADRSPDEVRSALGGLLPASMIPRQIHCLDSFPLTPNGKVDLAQLRRMAGRTSEAAAAAVPPGEELEPVRRLWEEILGCPVTSAHDDFFRLGGSSVDAARLALAIRQRHGVRIPVSLLYRHSTLAAFGAALADARRPASGRIARPGTGSAISQIESELEALCRARDVPGVQIAIGTPDGIVDLAWGRRDMERDLPVTRETVYPLNCCMKALFAIALSSLGLQGRIDLSAPLTDIYPEALDLLPGTHRDITLLDLLGHVGGFEDGQLQARTAGFRRGGTPRRVTGGLAALVPPRTVYLYSSLGYILLSDAVEHHLGLDWSRLIRQEVLEPLGIAADAGPAARRFDRSGPEQPWRNLPIDEARTRPMAAAASSALRLSAHDLARVMDNLVAGRGPAPAYRPGNLANITGWSFPIRAHPYRERSLIGWVSHWNGTIGHLGAGPGSMSYMHFCPETKLSFAMLSSCEESFDLYLDLCERLFGPFDAPAEPPLGLDRILGTYRSTYGEFALEGCDAGLELHRALPGGGVRTSLLTPASADGARWKLLDRQDGHFPTDSMELFEVEGLGTFARCGPTVYRKVAGGS